MVEQDIEWNINKAYGEEIIIKRMAEVDEASKLNDREWFEALRRLFRKIEWIKQVDREQTKIIDGLMQDAAAKLDQHEPNTDSQKAVWRTVQRNVKKDLDKIDRMINKVINESEIIKFHADFKNPSKSVLK